MMSDTSVSGAADSLLARHEAHGTPEPEAETEEVEATPETEPQEPEAEDVTEAEEEQQEEEPEAEEAEEEAPKLSDDTPVKVKVNGEEKEVTLREAKDGYMMRSDYLRKTQEVANQRKQDAAERQQYEANVSDRMKEVEFLVTTLHQQLVEQDNSTDWQALRRDNPAEFSARQEDIRQRKDLLMRAYNAHQQNQSQQEELQNRTRQQHLAEQAELLPGLIPEWLDENVSKRERAEIATYLVNDMGVPQEQVAQLSDARTVALARKAMLYDKQQSSRKTVAEKKAKNVPKFVKPGQPQPASTRKTKLEKLEAHARRSGRVEDFGAVLAAKHS